MKSEKKGKKRHTVSTTRSRKPIRKSRSILARRGFFGSFISITALCTIWGLAILLVIGIYQATQLPDLSDLEFKKRDIAVSLVDRKGQNFATYGDFYLEPVTFNEIPAFLIEALVATEDRRFFQHWGIDPFSLVRAAVVNLKEGKIKQGGSTLTQQLAKNLFLVFDRSVERKVQELLLALWLEMSFTKEQILTLYLNRVYFGSGVFGLRAAAEYYFGKSVSDLRLNEAAMLIGTLKAPSKYNPRTNLSLAKKRTTQVLNNMMHAGSLKKNILRKHAKYRVKIKSQLNLQRGTWYFADWIRERAEAYANNVYLNKRVFTTLDPLLQKKAEAALANQLKRVNSNKQLEGAVVVLDATGKVLAMVGGRNYFKSKFNRATQSRRQPGSVFKPVVFLAALSTGLSPETVISDQPLEIGSWRPKNFDGVYRTQVSLRQALQMSYNVATVRLSEKIGRDLTIKMAYRLGINAKLDDKPSLALGSSGVSLINMTAAYAAISNGGFPVEPYGISSIVTEKGELIYTRREQTATPIASSKVIEDMNRMLEGVIAGGTGKEANIGRTAAGKTGTSQDYRDAWFIGYSEGLTVGVWVGRDDNRPMRKITGGSIPAKIWGEFMVNIP
tara:strand:- start:897 stop:2738 length:1842 start_codon:yes stop_codon:yes gene_type:complete